MPDRRTHRGPHPEDRRLFAAGARPALRTAVRDLSLLLSRGYADAASLKLVGDRFSLDRRQRIAVMRAACSDQALDGRRARRLDLGRLAGGRLLIDGYNVLTTVEAALAGGVLLRCRDGAWRDMASVHGTYRKVAETLPAVRLLGRTLRRLGVAECLWYFDSPVSNSGRLREFMRREAAERNWPWRIELVIDPDPILARADEPVATSDSVILNRCRRWVNLAREVVMADVPDAWLLDLSLEAADEGPPQDASGGIARVRAAP